MAIGTTSDFNISRNQILEGALRKVGALPKGEPVDAATLKDGIRALNLIIREMDLQDRNLWKIASDPSSLTLVANTPRYTTANGLPTGILELFTASFREEDGTDTPLKIISIADYEKISDKLEQGTPEVVCFSARRDITATPTMFVWPVLDEVNAQSTVTGTNAAVYRCIRNHISTTDNKPITGADYLQDWEAGGSGPSVWAVGTNYTAPQQIRLRFKSPLADFDLATDNADLPSGFGRYLIYRLAWDWADDYHLPKDEKDNFAVKQQDAYGRVFPYQQEDTSNHHNRHSYI